MKVVYVLRPLRRLAGLDLSCLRVCVCMCVCVSATVCVCVCVCVFREFLKAKSWHPAQRVGRGKNTTRIYCSLLSCRRQAPSLCVCVCVCVCLSSLQVYLSSWLHIFTSFSKCRVVIAFFPPVIYAVVRYKLHGDRNITLRINRKMSLTALKETAELAPLRPQSCMLICQTYGSRSE